MFLKRLSIALCALMCFSGFVLGTNANTLPDAKQVSEESTLMAPLVVDFSLTHTAPRCKGDNDGSIIVTVTSGTGPYKIEFKRTSSSSFDVSTDNTPITPYTINDLYAGNYDVRVTDLGQSANNIDTRTIEVKQFGALSLNYSIPPVGCSSQNGTITLSASGGDFSNYTYTLERSGTTIQPNVGANGFSGLTADTYIARVIDGNGCPKTESGLTVSIPQQINPTVTVGTISCPGEKATITLNSLPADVSSYQIKLNGEIPSLNISGTSATINNLSAGSYDLTIERPSCSSDNWLYSANSIVIADFSPISFTWVNNPNNISINCFDGDTTLTVTLTGGKVGQAVILSLKNNETNVTTSLTTIQVNTPFDIPNIKKGNYTLIAEIVSCSYTKNSDPFIIGGPSIPFEITSESKTDVKCPGGSDGAITLNYSGGTAPIQYILNGGAPQGLPVNRTITGLAGGVSYSVVLKDSKGCITSIPAVLPIEVPNPINVTLSVTQTLSCPSGSNGILTASTIGGGSGGYRYTLKRNGDIDARYNNVTGGATRDFTGLIEGSYEVEVYTFGCTDNKTDQATILSIDDVAIDITYTPVLCRDAIINDFNVKATGGDGSAFTYTLKETNGTVHPNSPITEPNSGTGVTFNNVQPSKTYRVEVSYGTCGTVAIKDATINNPLAFNVTYPPTVDLKCYGGDTTISITASGKLPYYISTDGTNYAVFNNGNKHALNSLTDGTYAYYLRDGNGCEYNNGMPIPIVVWEPEALSSSVPVVTNVTCRGTNSGKVEVQITGGTPGYLATMGTLNPQSSSTGNIVFNNVPSGNYTLQITDNKGCTLNTPIPVFVDQPAELFTIETPQVVDPILCFGEQAGVVINVTGGWNVSKQIIVQGMGINQTQPSGSLFTLSAGGYTITATNADGCSAVPYYLNVTQPNRLVLSVTGSTNVSCAGAYDATIAFRVTGGVPVYLYGLGGSGSASNSFAGSTYTISGGLESGTYQLIVRDNNGCSSNIVPVTITEPTPVTFVVERVDSVECHGANSGRILIAAKGGSGSFQYALNGNITRPLQSSREFTNLTAGAYTVRVQDSKGCGAMVNNLPVNVGQPNNPVGISSVAITQQVSCNGRNDAAITISAIGGEPYVGLHYRVSRTINPVPANNEIKGLGAGLYDVFVSDSRGKCEKKWPTQVNIINPSPVTLRQTEKNDVSCHNSEDGSVKVTASGGRQPYTFYLYENNTPVGDGQLNGNFFDLGGISTNPNVSSARSYTVVVNDSSLCEQRHTFSITNPARLRISEQAHRQVTCNDLKDGWIRVSVTGGTGGYLFKKDYTDASTTNNITPVSTSVFTLNGYDGGNFRPLVMDAKGCTDTITNDIFIFNPPKLIIDNVIAGIKLCNNSIKDSTTIILDADNRGTKGNYRYSIDNGVTYQRDSLFINARQRTIQPMVVDSMGCAANYAELEIIWPDRFDVNITKNEIRCWNRQYGTLTLDINGGIGPYYFSVEDPLFLNDPIVIDKDNSRPTTIDTVGNPPNNLFLYGVPYEVYIKDHNNCAAENIGHPVTTTPVGTYTWQHADTLTLVNIDPTSPKCAGRHGTIQYTVKGGTEPYVYWVQNQQAFGTVEPTNQDDDGLVNVPTGMTLYAYVTDYYKCKAFVPDNQPYDFLTTIIHPANDTVKVEWEVLKQPYCPSTKDGRLGLEVTGFLKDGVTFNILKRGLSYSDNWNLIFSDQILREEATDSIPKPLPPGVEEVDAIEMLYSISDYKINYKFTVGDYKIEFYDNITRCDVSYDFVMEKENDECEDIFPKLFTPNNDGQNDLWMVSQYEKSNVSLKIFTAYGELVYEFSGLVPEEGLTWNGIDSFRKRPVPAGTYMYIYNPDVSEDKSKMEYGTITLLRNR